MAGASGVPILRLNSVVLEENAVSTPDLDPGLDLDHSSASEYFLSGGSSNYNTSDSDSKYQADPSVKSKTSNSGISNEQKRGEIIQKLVAQVELLFSDEHLANDGFLLKHIRRRSDGYVSLKLVAGLRKVKQITRDFSIVLEALRLSLKLDVNLDGTKIRRMEPLTPYLQSLPLNANTEVKKTTKVADTDFTPEELINRINMKNQQRQKFSANASPVSSGPNSRHGSFSKPNFNLSPMNSPKLNRRQRRDRAGSLPVSPNASALDNKTGGNIQSPQFQKKKTFLSPTASAYFKTAKSNSYCEGMATTDSTTKEEGGMSVWLQQRRKSSEGAGIIAATLNGITRQPRGPDGTNGFARIALAQMKSS